MANLLGFVLKMSRLHETMIGGREMVEDQIFAGEDYVDRRPFDGEVDACSFERCDFTDSDLSEVTFIDSTFEGCNLSMADLAGASLRDVRFEECKLVGVDFGVVNGFGFSVGFDGCKLDYASFEGREMPETEFSECSLREAVFTEADLTEAVFDECDLSGAIFARTTLESADFRTARHFAIDPELNRIREAQFSRDGLEGLLQTYEIEVE